MHKSGIILVFAFWVWPKCDIKCQTELTFVKFKVKPEITRDSFRATRQLRVRKTSPYSLSACLGFDLLQHFVHSSRNMALYGSPFTEEYSC